VFAAWNSFWRWCYLDWLKPFIGRSESRPTESGMQNLHFEFCFL
jgi:hypothetical protein